MTNTNPTTGIRYGVISCQSLDGDVVHELFYGSGARDLSFEHAAEELREGIETEADEIEDYAREQALLHFMESDPHAGEKVREDLEERHIDEAYEQYSYPDRESFIDGEYESRVMHIQTEEPDIEGELDGVKYLISHLGGAPLLWVVEGPEGFAKRLCSPCVPNAADLDGGFVGENEDDGYGYPCYVVPQDWLRKEHATC